MIIRLIVGSAVARAQRDNKVDLCHDIWNGSHPHLFVISYDAQKFVDFYSELQKKITDGIKRLLGEPYLRIWESRTTVTEIRDLNVAIERISYLYANPGQDDLEESIDSFPGYSSWKLYQRAEDTLQAEAQEEFPWIRLPSIPKIGRVILSSKQDLNLVRLLRKRNKKKLTLVRKPNIWMKCFGVESDEDVREINQRIVSRIRDREFEARERRKRSGKPVMGAKALRSQSIMQTHTPKKRARKVFFVTTINELRLEAIAEFKEVCDKCRECYASWKAGDFRVEWPPGTFKPPIPPSVNFLPNYC